MDNRAIWNQCKDLLAKIDDLRDSIMDWKSIQVIDQLNLKMNVFELKADLRYIQCTAGYHLVENEPFSSKEISDFKVQFEKYDKQITQYKEQFG